jgi:hypothetical protein
MKMEDATPHQKKAVAANVVKLDDKRKEYAAMLDAAPSAARFFGLIRRRPCSGRRSR